MTSDPPARQRVAFIGLGQMGGPMAANLVAAGVDLRVFDMDARRMGPFAERAAESAAAAVAEADMVILMLPDGRAVEAILFDPAPGGGAGLAGLLKPGCIVVDMGSSDPYLEREICARLARSSIGMIDAPVSGGVKRARTGELAIMAGGDAAHIDACEPVLAVMGARVFRLGPVGSGQAMKALNNLVSAAALLATVEALVIGERFGLKPADMVEVLNASTGRSNATENKISQFILSGRYDSGFAMKLLVKDIGAALGIASTEEIEAPESAACEAVWRSAFGDLQETADHTEIFRWFAGRSASLGVGKREEMQ